MRPKTGEDKRGTRGAIGGQGQDCNWRDRTKLEMFQSRVDCTDPRIPEAASATPTGKA